jgi:DNA-binding transcriptional LysR family regulator
VGVAFEELATIALSGALLGATHPLARKDPLMWSDLSTLPLVTGRPTHDPAVMDLVSRRARECGLEIRRRELDSDLDSIDAIDCVAAGDGWELLPSATGAAIAQMPGVVFREVASPPIPLGIYLLWLEEKARDALVRFLAIARCTAATQ